MKIVIASGGTLGHLMPIIPVVKKLRELNHEIFLFTTKNLIYNKKVFNKILNFNAVGLNKNLIKVYIVNNKVYKKIKEELKKEKIDLVIGMGGYISGISIRAANSLNIKTIIHEQNSIMGTANKLVLKKVNLLIYSNKSLKVKKENKIYLPSPRSEEAYNLNKIYKKNDKQILFVSGSLGAKFINEVAINTACRFKDYKIILFTGNRYYDEYKEYKKDNLYIYPRTSNLIKYIIESKVIVSRAGATTISEIIGSKSVGIYIPSPNVTKNHQEKNCDFIIEEQLGVVILEKEIVEYNIQQQINEVLDNYNIYYNNLNKLKFDNVINKYIKVICGDND